MQKALCSIFFQALAFASSSFGAQSSPAVPELPRLSLDNFSPGIQEQIREAYSYARSHPRDANASGRLGMVLQTYGLFQEAAVCYRRGGQDRERVVEGKRGDLGGRRILKKKKEKKYKCVERDVRVMIYVQ